MRHDAWGFLFGALPSWLISRAAAESVETPVSIGAAEEIESSASLSSWVAWAAMGAAAVLILVIILLIRRGKHRKAEMAAQTPEPKSPAPFSEVERETLPITSIGNVHGIGTRSAQQDAFGVSSIADNRLVQEKGILAIVADGMGGMENSGEISRTIVRSALKRFLDFQGNQRETLLMLGAEINSLASEHFSARTGTTFIAASIRENLLDFISIGDSRVALCRAGSLLTLNRAHNYAADLDSSAARGLVSVESAMKDPKRARLTSYVGMGEPCAVDMPATPVNLNPGDRVILMTDGVFGTLTDGQIAEALSLSAPEAAKRLEKMIQEAGRPDQDNFTAIIIEI